MYSKAFRTLMVQKMTSPDRPDVESLAAEVGNRMDGSFQKD